jgi:hypothetical protein
LTPALDIAIQRTTETTNIVFVTLGMSWRPAVR